MLLVTLAGLSGLVWGVADFAGGKASRGLSVLPVVWLSKIAGLPLLVLVLVTSWTPPPLTGLGWGVGAGVCGTTGTLLFYRALSAGSMAAVAPITAVTSAVIPVGVGLALGERPASAALAGVGCAVAAIAFVSLTPARQGLDPPDGRQVPLVWSVGAGVAFASFMTCLARAGRGAGAEHGLWPVLASHVTGVLVASGARLVVRTGRSRTGAVHEHRAAAHPSSLRWACVAGLVDTAGTAVYLSATRIGDLSVVAPIASLYPATTVLLALLVDRERPRVLQLTGLALAVAALQLVTRPAG